MMTLYGVGTVPFNIIVVETLAIIQPDPLSGNSKITPLILYRAVPEPPLCVFSNNMPHMFLFPNP